MEKFRKPVENTVKGEKRSELRFLDVEIGLQCRHRNAQILANKVKDRIANEARNQNAVLPVTELSFDRYRIRNRYFCRRLRFENIPNGFFCGDWLWLLK